VIPSGEAVSDKGIGTTNLLYLLNKSNKIILIKSGFSVKDSANIEMDHFMFDHIEYVRGDPDFSKC